MLAIQGFRIGLCTTRDIYLDGESFQLQVDTADAQGKPVGQSLSAAIVKLIESAGRVTEREMQRKQLTTDAKTGHGSLAFQIDDQGGRPLRRARGGNRPVRQPDRRRSAAARSRERKTRPSCACWPTASATRSARKRASTCIAATGPAPLF